MSPVSPVPAKESQVKSFESFLAGFFNVISSKLKRFEALIHSSIVISD